MRSTGPTQLWLRGKPRPVQPGVEVAAEDCDVLAVGECDVFKPNGDRLLSVRRGVWPAEQRELGREILRPLSKTKTDNRGVATGGRFLKVKEDGVPRQGERGQLVSSSIIGYFDRSGGRFPYCRQTVFTANKENRFDALVPSLQRLAACFAESVPDRFARQMENVSQTSRDFVILGTPWTTITVNHNWHTRVHQDKGDLKEGFSCLAVLRSGEYTGGALLFPAWGLGVDLYDGDLAMLDAHEWHANTPFVVLEGETMERISMVLYYRERMGECGSAEEELSRAKNRVQL